MINVVQKWLETSQLADNGLILQSTLDARPTLHDCEILNLLLNRQGPVLDLVVLLAPVHSSAPPDGSFIITIRFYEVADVELSEFNYQNVIQAFTAEQIFDSRATGQRRLRIDCQSAFGASLRFTCSSVGAIDFKATHQTVGNPVL